eukprot:TRINITY_DN47048_c0_g1_i1.p1 TRINITY_DN47048_c0_g1~~TRINITY_DN47048_c0_g1_i1.p1  ORF type:complete len:336 (+),score=82.37 TRINITY_DN47048_c0_g1_i1:88-1008(+)
MAAAPMRVISVNKSQKAFPTGDPKFCVNQPFPGTIAAEDADPFLMCDHFGPTPSKGVVKDPDEYPVGWHPHRGMDIVTYLRSGRGRHADSLGNREEFATPGMQWISVGSGIEHAEGGGTPEGEMQLGFQIWVNVPSARKMDDPRYGTVPPEEIPLRELASGVHGRLLAGSNAGHVGPFRTVQPVQIMDISVQAGARYTHVVPPELDNCMAYVFRGGASIGGSTVDALHVIHLDATQAAREVTFVGGPEGADIMFFAGKRLKQPIAWHGPFVMTTDAEIHQTISECRRGAFPPKRVQWDYKRAAARP